jgi:hypothetical protein
MSKHREEVRGMEADLIDFLSLRQLDRLLRARWELFEVILGDELAFNERLQDIFEARDRLAGISCLADIQAEALAQACGIFSSGL